MTAIHVAQKKGRIVKEKLANLLLRKEDVGEGLAKHHAAVLPAMRSDIKVIAAKAADEWPDGNERRPSRITAALLKHMSSQQLQQGGRTDPVHACRAESH